MNVIKVVNFTYDLHTIQSKIFYRLNKLVSAGRKVSRVNLSRKYWFSHIDENPLHFASEGTSSRRNATKMFDYIYHFFFFFWKLFFIYFVFLLLFLFIIFHYFALANGERALQSHVFFSIQFRLLEYLLTFGKSPAHKI